MLIAQIEELVRNKQRSRSEIESLLGLAHRNWELLSRDALVDVMLRHPDVFRVAIDLGRWGTKELTVVHQQLVHIDSELLVVDLFVASPRTRGEATIMQVFHNNELLFVRELAGWTAFVSAKDVITHIYRTLLKASDA